MRITLLVLSVLLLLACGQGGGAGIARENSDAELRPADRPSAAGNSSGKRALAPHIVGYFGSWSIYERDYHVMDIPAQRLTHVNYAFADVSPAGEVTVLEPWADVQKRYPGDTDEQAFRGNFNQLNKLKQEYPHLRTLIAVGGSSWSGGFSDAARSAKARERFARSAVDFIVTYGFDGIDINWEYPVSGPNGRPEDKRNYTLLLRELRRQLEERSKLDEQRYLLTAAIGTSQGAIDNLELDQLSAYVDWFNLMTYDYYMAGAWWHPSTNHHAGLSTVEQAVARVIGAGAPAQQLVLGVPFYGHGWQGVERTNNGLFQSASINAPAGSHQSGDTGNGMFDYRHILELIDNEGYERHWDPKNRAPWVFNAERRGGHFISYEDRASVVLKADFVRRHGLRGMMIWECAYDDPRAERSLLEAMRGRLNR